MLLSYSFITQDGGQIPVHNRHQLYSWISGFEGSPLVSRIVIKRWVSSSFSEDVDLGYVRVNSPELCVDVDREVACISDAVNTAIGAAAFMVGSSPRSAASSPSISVQNYGIGNSANHVESKSFFDFRQMGKSSNYTNQTRILPKTEKTVAGMLECLSIIFGVINTKLKTIDYQRSF